MKEDGIPDCGIYKHKVTPRTKLVEGIEKPALFRYDIKSEGDHFTVYCPKTLSDEEATSDILKRAVFGAALKGRFVTLPMRHGGVRWDMEMCKTPPAMLKPIKPKFWLEVQVELQHGLY